MEIKWKDSSELVLIVLIILIVLIDELHVQQVFEKASQAIYVDRSPPLDPLHNFRYRTS